MTDQPFLDPKQAQTAISVVAQQQGLFLTALNNFGQALVKLESNSLNDQISNADILGAKLQGALGNFVATSMSNYFDKLVEVFEKWRKSDFPTAQPIMYMCFAFQPVKITGQCFIKSKVSLNLIKSTANELQNQLDKMLACFDEIDRQVRTSSQWWRGDGADKSRNTWINKYYPKRALIKQEVAGFIVMLRGVGDDLGYRDAGSANSGEDLLEWYPMVCETVYGELNIQHQDLKKKQTALEEKPERSILGMVGVSADYASVIEAVRKTNLGLDRWLLVQEPYRDRIKAPYAPLSIPDPEATPISNSGSGPQNLPMVQIKDPYRANFKPALDPGVTGDDITDPNGIKAEDLLAQMPSGLGSEVYLALATTELGNSAKDLRAQADQKRKDQEALAKQFDEANKITSVPLEYDKEWMQAVQDKNNAKLDELAKKRDWAYKVVSSWEANQIKLVDAERDLRQQADDLEKMSGDLQKLLATSVPGAPPLPLNGLMIPDDKSRQPMALTLYLKPYQDGDKIKWQVLDITRPYATRTYDGDTAADAMRNFVENNDLPAGRVAVGNPKPPLEYGLDIGVLPTRADLNKQSDGKSDWQQWRDGASAVGWGGLIAAVFLGIAGFFTEGAAWAGIPWALGVSGIAFGASSVFNITDRVTYGHFAWDFETFMDVLNIGFGIVEIGSAVRVGGMLVRSRQVGGAVVYELVDDAGKVTAQVVMDLETANKFSTLSKELKALETAGGDPTKIAALKQQLLELEAQALRDGKMVFQGATPKVQQQVATLKAQGFTDEFLANAGKLGYSPGDLTRLLDKGLKSETLTKAINSGYKSSEILALADKGFSPATITRAIDSGLPATELQSLLGKGIDLEGPTLRGYWEQFKISGQSDFAGFIRVQAEAKSFEQLTMGEFRSFKSIQQKVFDFAEAARARQDSFARNVLHELGITDANYKAIMKRDRIDLFVQGVLDKAERKGYTSLTQMDDIIRGRINLSFKGDVEAIRKSIESQTQFEVVHIEPIRKTADGLVRYPRYHIILKDAETGLTFEWQIGTQATTDLYEKVGIEIPEALKEAIKANGKTVKPDLHDFEYDLFQTVNKKYPELGAKYNLPEFIREVAEASDKSWNLGQNYTGLGTDLTKIHSRASEILEQMVKDYGADWVVQFFH